LSDEKGSTRIPFGGAQSHPGSTEATVEQELHDEAAERVPDQHRRLVELADQRFIVVDDLVEAEAGQLVCVLAKLLDVALLARPFRGGDGESAGAEVVGEVLPATRREPGAVDEQQRGLGASGRGGGHAMPPGRGYRADAGLRR
jgi:hypothetical protein